MTNPDPGRPDDRLALIRRVEDKLILLQILPVSVSSIGPGAGGELDAPLNKVGDSSFNAVDMISSAVAGGCGAETAGVPGW